MNLEIFGSDPRCTVRGLIVFIPQLLQIRGQSRLAVLVELRKGDLRRSKILAEQRQYFSGRKRIVEIAGAARAVNLFGAATKALAHYLFISPQRRQRNVCRRRDVSSAGAEHLADEAQGSPVGHRDTPAGSGNAQQLSRNQLGTRREHGAES